MQAKINPEEQIQRQIELENLGVDLGAKAYREALAKARDKKEGCEGFMPEHTTLTRYMDLLLRGNGDTKGLVDFMTVPRNVGTGYKIRKYIMDQDPIELAFITLKVFINHLHLKEIMLTNLAVNIGTAINEHVYFKRFVNHDPKYYKNLKRYTRLAGAAHARTAIKVIANRDEQTTFVEWPKNIRRDVGHKLLDLLVHTTGIAERIELPPKRKKEAGPKVLVVNPELLTMMDDAHAYHEVCQPIHFPMIVPPGDWEDMKGGGYLSQEIMSRYKMVSRSHKCTKQDGLLENLDPLTQAINALQQVPWAINKPILDIMHQINDLKNGLAGTPVMDKKCMFTDFVTPWSDDKEREIYKEANPDAYKKVMRNLKNRHDNWARSVTKRSGWLKQLMIADKIRDERAIWFCYKADWRGRINAMQTHVSPQANDSGKAVLRFATGKLLIDREGLGWWKIHGAGCYAEETPDISLAVDKLAFKERVDWVDRHAQEIVDSGLRPMDGQGFWLTADKPLQFLAWCMEFAQYVKEGMSLDFVSHIPVALDGSCSGLQHMSGALRDEICAVYVNLTASVSPEDVYRRVAEVVAPLVAGDAEAGDKFAKMWNGKITRKVTKSAVMTFVYGATNRTYTEQLMELLQKYEDKGKPFIKVAADQRWDACTYMKNQIVAAMHAVIVKGSELMAWFQAVATIFGKADIPMWWRTPDDVKVYQTYRTMTKKRVDTYWGEIRYQPRVQTPSPAKIDTTGIKNGMTPNWTHGMDACHLRTAINEFLAVVGHSIVVIHDSFGTHACDAASLSRTLRGTFQHQYEVDHVARFLEDIREQLPDELFALVPPRPMPGSWDPKSMEGAVYSFA